MTVWSLVLVLLLALQGTLASNMRGGGGERRAKKVVGHQEPLTMVVADTSEDMMESTLSIISTEDHIISNIALNKTVRLSSSSSADLNYGRFAVDGEIDTFVESAIERYEPYLVVDLGSESYIDEITIISPLDLGDVATYATDVKSLAFTRNASELLDRAAWHSAAFGAGTHVTLHAHATGRYVRVQLTESGKRLRISELVVRGVKLNPREKAFSQCLSGHDGSEVCSSRGVCARGRCSCGAFYHGHRCEHVRVSVMSTCTSFFIVSVGLLYLLRKFRARFRLRRSGVWKKLDAEMLSGPQNDSNKNMLIAKAPSPNELEHLRSRTSTPSTNAPLKHSSSSPDLVYETEPFKLHVLFASPLVMLTDTEVLPVASLDVEREVELLSRSLTQGGARQRVQMEVTCATIDALQSVLTLREASVMHVSSHCQPEVIALEDNSGAAHLISGDALSNLLSASKPALQSSRLIVLNCCHSAGIARAFIQAGFEHVVALSEDLRVRDATAATFTRAFYLALASAHTVGDAFRLAKEAVTLCPSSRPGEANAFVLLPEHTAHDEVIWPRVSSSSFGANTQMTPFANPGHIPGACEDFVGRSHELWTVLQMLHRHRVVNVYGRKGSGKTAMVTQLAHHVRLRKSEASFADGVYFISLEASKSTKNVQEQSEEFNHEVQCAQIAESLAGFTMSRPASPPLMKQSGHQTGIRRSVSRSSRDAGIHKFALEKPSSLVILDGLSPSLLDSRCFQELISSLLKMSSKIQIVTASEGRFETAAIKVFNVLCGPLSDLDTARLLMRLCHPRLVAPSIVRTDAEPQHGLGEADDEFEDTARSLSQCLVVRSLVGHPESVRKLAMTVNARCGMGETYAFSDDMDW